MLARVAAHLPQSCVLSPCRQAPVVRHNARDPRHIFRPCDHFYAHIPWPSGALDLMSPQCVVLYVPLILDLLIVQCFVCSMEARRRSCRSLALRFSSLSATLCLNRRCFLVNTYLCLSLSHYCLPVSIWVVCVQLPSIVQSPAFFPHERDRDAAISNVRSAAF
jgi:hypothetical protein